jgi:hypothetical protein
LPVEAAGAARNFEVQLVRLRFKPDGKRVWLDWAEELKRRRAEVIATLRNEGVRSEACFLSKDGESVFYFMESADSAKVTSAFDTSKLPIDAEHKAKLRSSLEIVEAMTPLFGFQNDVFSNG